MIKITIYDARTNKPLEIIEAPYPRFTKQHYDVVKRSVLFNLTFIADNIAYFVEVNNKKVIVGGAININKYSFYWTSTLQNLSKSFCNNFYSKCYKRENLEK